MRARVFTSDGDLGELHLSRGVDVRQVVDAMNRRQLQIAELPPVADASLSAAVDAPPAAGDPTTLPLRQQRKKPE